jgi:DNA-binding SARP family transcriptional activator
LRICLFGNLEVQSSVGSVCLFPTDKSRRLFAFLVLNSHRRYARESLAANFWQRCGKATALKSLRAELWRMRQALELAGSPNCFHVNRYEVGFNRAAAESIDSEEFEARIAPLSSRRGADLDESEARIIQDAVALYRGDVLEDVYDDWAIVYRERMRELYLQALEILICFHAGKSSWCEAVLHTQRLLSIDPLREHIQRQLIRFHYLRGDRAAAMRQYALCRDLLAHELDVQPMTETQELYRSIVTQQPVSSAVFQPRERMQKVKNGQRLDELPGHGREVASKSDIVFSDDSVMMSSEQILDLALSEVARLERHIARVRDLIQGIHLESPSLERD